MSRLPNPSLLISAITSGTKEIKLVGAYDGPGRGFNADRAPEWRSIRKANVGEARGGQHRLDFSLAKAQFQLRAETVICVSAHDVKRFVGVPGQRQ